MAVVKNGTSRYDIKEWLVTEVAPRYFDKIPNLSDLNVGLFGYINDVLAETTRDNYFAISTLYKEIFPQLAELPESIYNHALIYQLSNTFAIPAKCYFTMLIAEDSIINNSTTTSQGYSYFDIDSGMSFMIDGKNFMLDYDIRISSKKTATGYSHTAQYKIDRENPLSDLYNPYILSGIYLGDNRKRYISLQVTLHQVAKKQLENVITSNDYINAVTLEYAFTNQLANFEIFYKSPSSTSYTQLKKQLENTAKLEDPFCFYSLTNDQTLKITFSNDEHYFQPEYNSDLIIELYTTLGADGNFEKYDGNTIQVIGKYDKYSSNRGVVFMGNVLGSSENGSDRMTLEDLQNETIKSYSTVKSFTTPNDLNLYFNDVMAKANEKTKVAFMKKRDDAYERLYNAFVLFKDQNDNVVPTNTLDVIVKSADVDYNLVQTSRNVIKAGKIYQYIEDAEEPYAKVRTDLDRRSDLDVFENSSDEFIYMNPFLMILGTNPLSAGFYINTISSSSPVDYIDIGSESFYQFIVDTIEISRNAINGDDEYEFTVKMNPSSELEEEAFQMIEEDTKLTDEMHIFYNEYNGYTYLDNENLRVVLEIMGTKDERKAFVLLQLEGFNEEYYIFKGKIRTNDYLSVDQELQITHGLRDPETFEENNTKTVLIPSTDCNINIYVLYEYPDLTVSKETEFNKFKLLANHTLTNKYKIDNAALANFVIPVKEIRSCVEYVMKEAEGKYTFRLEAVPLIKANYMRLAGARENFLKSLNNVYKYLEIAMNQLPNNFNIDIKFFNTYGRSKHYYLVNSEEHIDKINVSLEYNAKFNIVNPELIIEDIKLFIKNKIESEEISLVASPSFYSSSISATCFEKFPNLVFLDLVKINLYGTEVQSLESDVNENNIIQELINTDNIIPEYLNIDQLIKNGEITNQITINVLS